MHTHAKEPTVTTQCSYVPTTYKEIHNLICKIRKKHKQSSLH